MTRMRSEYQTIVRAARGAARRLLGQTRDVHLAWEQLSMTLVKDLKPSQLAGALAEATLDGILSDAARTDPTDRPDVVVLCGSTRFRGEFHQAARTLTLNGAVVLAPGVFGHADGEQLPDDVKTSLDELHLRKIDMADQVIVINPGGYIGDSTRREIAYAMRTGKPVSYWSAAPGEDYATAGQPHPTAAARAQAAAEQLPTVGHWNDPEHGTLAAHTDHDHPRTPSARLACNAERNRAGHRVNAPIPAGPDRHA